MLRYKRPDRFQKGNWRVPKKLDNCYLKKQQRKRRILKNLKEKNLLSLKRWSVLMSSNHPVHCKSIMEWSLMKCIQVWNKLSKCPCHQRPLHCSEHFSSVLAKLIDVLSFQPLRLLNSLASIVRILWHLPIDAKEFYDVSALEARLIQLILANPFISADHRLNSIEN